MGNLFSRKKLGLASGIAGLAIGGVVAYAYFTTTGSGTANGTVGSSSNLVIAGALSGGASDGNFYPGGPAQTVTFTITNNSPGNQVLTVIHLNAVHAYANASDQSSKTNAIAGCGTSDFSMANVTVNQDLAPGDTVLTPTGSISMVDTGLNQDACQGALLTFDFTAADPGATFAPSPAIPTP